MKKRRNKTTRVVKDSAKGKETCLPARLGDAAWPFGRGVPLPTDSSIFTSKSPRRGRNGGGGLFSTASGKYWPDGGAHHGGHHCSDDPRRGHSECLKCPGGKGGKRAGGRKTDTSPRTVLHKALKISRYGRPALLILRKIPSKMIVVTLPRPSFPFVPQA